jgi:hypothetical protein
MIKAETSPTTVVPPMIPPVTGCPAKVTTTDATNAVKLTTKAKVCPRFASAAAVWSALI